MTKHEAGKPEQGNITYWYTENSGDRVLLFAQNSTIGRRPVLEITYEGDLIRRCIDKRDARALGIKIGGIGQIFLRDTDSP